MVVLDGKLVKPKGTVTMNGDHYLWAFGNPKSGKKFENVMTVPADVTKIPYPAFYQRTPSFTFNVADPYCAITSDVIAYPASYLGEFPLPAIQGAPLPSAVPRGVSLRDYWESQPGSNPNLNQDCSGTWRDSLIPILKRLKRLGADHVINYQTAIPKDAAAPALGFEKDMRMNDTDLAWIVAQAKAQGLKYHNYMAIMGRQPLPANPSSAWFSDFLDAWTTFIVGRAVVAERLGIEALQLDWSAYWFDVLPMKSLYVQKMTNLARKVRAVYSGKIFLGTSFIPRKEDPDLLKSIDRVIVGFQYGLSDEENARPDVAAVKSYAFKVMGWVSDWMGPDAPPVVFSFFVGSFRNALINGGWLEDAFCTPSPEDCTQRRTRTDFSVQAIGIEGTLEAIREQTLLKTASVEALGYWYTDVIRPKDSFPNLSPSFRNKPAESIVYEWFKR